ncbi:MAG: ABC transporter permease [Christensenellales bacterium]
MTKKVTLGQRIQREVKQSWDLYLLAIPMVAYYIIFCYGPMYGVQIAFLDYNPFKGIAGSKYVGLKHFINFFSMPTWQTYLWNTLRISLSGLVFSFPIPIILALMFNSLPNKRFRKTVQTVFYMPHFVSTVVLIAILDLFINSEVGVINKIIRAIGLTPINFDSAAAFLPSYIISGIWSGAGWGTIIYTGALTSIPSELYEAAMIDGATKMQRIKHIELPAIIPTLSITLIMAVGGIMSVGHEKTFLMQKATNISVSEIISTYTYKSGLVSSQFSYASAIGLTNSIVNCFLLIIANYASRKFSGTALW